MRHAGAWIVGLITALAATTGSAQDIFDAVRSRTPERVEGLLDKDQALVSVTDPSGQTPLHVAAQTGDAAMVRLLVGRGAPVNAQDKRGMAPLHVLAARGDLDGMTLLLDKGAQVDARAADGATPLHQAAMGRQVAAIRLLASRKANLEITNNWGRTALVAAAREMRGPSVVGALLDLGARIDAADKSGDTALTLAAWRGSADVVGLLLSRGADVPIGGARGRHLLGMAASAGLVDLFTRMVEKGADLQNAPAPARTLLHAAAEGGAVPILTVLVDRRFEVTRADPNGWTPLHFAVDMGRPEAVEFLLAKGADLNARTVRGQTAYHVARDRDDAAMMARLAARGVDQTPPRFPELRGPYLGQTPPGPRPEAFAPGIVSARFTLHSTIVFSPDGTEAFWRESIPPRTAGYSSGRTLVSRLVNGRWTFPEPAVFDGTPLDDVPFFHPDGRRLYDMSPRALPGGRMAGKENIWVWQRSGTTWTRPQPVDQTVNRLPHHWQFSIDRAGTLYFTSTWAGARGIFSSRLVDGAYTEPVSLESVLGPDAEFPFAAPDGSYLLFVRQQQLHVSFRDTERRWGAPVSLGSDFRGTLPIVSPDGKYLFFGGREGIKWADASVVDKVKPRRP